MSKIRAYYSDSQNWITLFNSNDFISYVSKDPMFWISTYGNSKTVMIYVNGDDNDHGMMGKQTGIRTTDIDDIRAVIDQQKTVIDVTKTLDTDSKLTTTDLNKAITVRDVLTKAMQELDPVQKTLSFDNAPKSDGTFTDILDGSTDELIESRTGWSIIKDGSYILKAKFGGNLVSNTGGGGSGDSYWTCTDQGSSNQYITVMSASLLTLTDCYACVRLVDEDNFIGYHLGGNGSVGARLCKFVSGSLTDSIVATQGATSYKFKIECDGNTVSFFRDTGSGFAQIGTNQTISDHATETSSGFTSKGAYSTTGVWSYFENGTVGSVSSTLLPKKLNGGLINNSLTVPRLIA